MHKAGFVNIVGNPNVGKSTLMNQLIGERISIATFKAQTTRHRIMGIVNTDDAQIVFSDTPGVLKPNYKLQESMLAFSESALQDADVLLYVTDVVENPEKNMDFLDKVKKMTIPVLLLINKIDMSDQKQLGDIVEKWHTLLPNAEILPISAQNKFGTDMLMKRIQELLPPSPPYFDKDQLTDKPARFFVSEIIREKILLYYDKEIPYSVEVRVDMFKEEQDKINIHATVADDDALLRVALHIDDARDMNVMLILLEALSDNLHRIGHLLVVVAENLLTQYLADEELGRLVGELVFVEIGRRVGQQFLDAFEQDVGAELILCRNGKNLGIGQ